MSVITREALAALNLKLWQFVEDAFGSSGGAWLRGYSQAEIEGWTDLARVRGQFSPARFKALQIAHCTAVDEAGTLLFANPASADGMPAAGDIDAICNGLVPPGLQTRLILKIDALAGFDNGELLGLGEAVKPSPGSASPSGSASPTESTSASGASTGSDAGPANSTSRRGSSGGSS